MSCTTRPAGGPGEGAVEKRGDLPYSTFAEAAAALAKLGWHVFPIASKSKRPLVKWANGAALRDADFETIFTAHLAEKIRRLAARGIEFRNSEPSDNLDLLRATTDQCTVGRWWHLWPQANIGVATGVSGLLVLDVDRHGCLDGFTSLMELAHQYGPLPRVVVQRTGRNGLHLFFATPTGRPIRNSVGKLGPGIDIRGSGGMAVVAPSLHASGARYRWIKKRDPWTMLLPKLPAWLLSLLDPQHAPSACCRMPITEIPANLSRYAERSLRSELDAVRRAVEGSRNDALNRACFSLAQLASAGLLDVSLTRRLLAGAALSNGLSEKEIAHTMRSGWQCGFDHPRELKR